MNSRTEKRCPLCKREYGEYDVAIPGVFRGFYYDETKEQILNRPHPPEILYHYTSLEKLISILGASEKKLRAGHYSQMNDWAEVLLGIRKMQEHIKHFELWEENEIKKLKADIKKIKEKKWSCFIFSLTEKKDLLSQWRAYTSSEGGVCLGFSSVALANLAKTDNLSLVPCSYTNEARDIDLDNVFDVAKYRASAKGQRIMNKQKEIDDRYISYLLSSRRANYEVEYTLEDLVEVATTVKDYGFFEEQEWRLVSWNNTQKLKKEMISPRGKKYIEFDFCPKTWIEDIIISPHGDTSTIRNTLDYFQRHGVLSKKCPIHNSRIPFRG